MKRIVLTSNYKSVQNKNKISISGDRGRSVDFIGKSLIQLAPKKEFWKIWHDNIGKISEEENTLYYIKNYYNQVLKNLDPEILIGEIQNKILLCYEESNEFCHRHLVAFWLELFLDIKTYEVKELEKNKLEIQERPEYLKEMLEQIIKQEYNMHGFNCIKAAYLFEVAEILEQNIQKKYKQNILDEYAGELYTMVARLRMDADEAEEKYLHTNKNKVKKYTD